ncbi:MAG: hypothetical protein ABFS56_09115 [Pseudomonadota bacterium]
MNLQFNNIANDDRYSFLPKDLRKIFRNAVENAGRRNIVFVEGYDDEVIYTILYEDNLKELCFIDIGFTDVQEDTGTGNCEKVKKYLKDFVQHLPKEKRFSGVIDRDLKTDQEVEDEKNKPCYDGRLFIFFERYTLENYFVEPDILYEFLRGQSINKKKLIPILKQDKEHFETEVIKPILTCLTDIAAANLTIRHFDSSEKFLEDSIYCEYVENRLVHKLNKNPEKEKILSKFSEFKKELINEPLKFASAKGYFATQFNRELKKQTKVNIQLNNHKSELARILKERGIPKDFRDLLSLILTD